MAYHHKVGGLLAKVHLSAVVRAIASSPHSTALHCGLLCSIPQPLIIIIKIQLFILYLHILKQFSAILLLSIFAFNIFGYKIYFAIAENNSDAIIENKIEKQQYQTTDLVAYKVPAKQLPYYTNCKSYEVANGEVNVKGNIMTYVKKRIYKDSIEYLCLPNEAKTNLRTAREDFFKLVNDLQNESQQHSPKKQQHNTKPFSFDAVAFEVKENNFYYLITPTSSVTSYKNKTLPNPYLQVTCPPPNFG